MSALADEWDALHQKREKKCALRTRLTRVATGGTGGMTGAVIRRAGSWRGGRWRGGGLVGGRGASLWEEERSEEWKVVSCWAVAVYRRSEATTAKAITHSFSYVRRFACYSLSLLLIIASLLSSPALPLFTSLAPLSSPPPHSHPLFPPPRIAAI